jgi:hypothetical protein
MKSVNPNEETRKQNFKQVEAGGGLSHYLAAISAGVVMTVVLLLAISCSHKSTKTKATIEPPARPTSAEPPAPSQAATVTPQAPKRIKKHRPQSATYVNSVYGVSFNYPRRYRLEVPKENSSLPVEPGFLKSGVVEIVALDMPSAAYRETDFSSALLNVSVNPQLTAEECGRFKSSLIDRNAEQPVMAKLGPNQFTEFEVSEEKADGRSEVKYFHLFKNAACYEFTLDVETARKPEEALPQLDRGKIFAQLEKILATTRIQELELPGIENAQQKSDSEAERSAEIVAPEHK